MTKSREGGSNEVTEDARREAARTRTPICDVLAAKLAAAKLANDTELIRRLSSAEVRGLPDAPEEEGPMKNWYAAHIVMYVEWKDRPGSKSGNTR